MSTEILLQAQHIALSVRHQANKEPFVLGPISFDMQPGEIVAVIGETGSGKSLLLHALAGLVPVEQGELIVNGNPLHSTPLDRYHRSIAFSFQQHALLEDRTALENVVLAAETRGQENPHRLAALILKELDIAFASDAFPHALSGGMRKRVGLARALAANSPLLIADEPTAGLDPSTASIVMNGIKQRIHSENMGAILSTHDVDQVVPYADRILLLANGQQVLWGPPSDLEKDDAFSPFVPMRAFEAAQSNPS